jgi:CRISPR-associated endonuclease/helicase Cas3
MAIGHTRNREGARHDLTDHLRAVAELTSESAMPLGAADLGRYLGLYHDIGKFHPAFQAYLERCEAEPERQRRGPDHKAAGAELARAHLGYVFSLIVQAHHGGLQRPVDWKAWLDHMLSTGDAHKAVEIAGAAIPNLRPDAQPTLPQQVETAASPLEVELFVRLRFSSLVDADSLDTERHFEPDRHALRGRAPVLEELWRRFETSQTDLIAGAPTNEVMRQRGRVYQACLDAAESPPGGANVIVCGNVAALEPGLTG